MNDKDLVVRKLEGTKKYLYCPKCKCYPDNIIEKCTHIDSRKWNEDNECYEMIDELDSECIYSKCAECDTILVENE